MENTLETLIKLKKSTILNSKFKYTTYMGKMVSEYFFDISFPYRAEKYNFNNLINKLLLPQLPIFSFFDFIEYRHIYEKYPHLYLYFYNKAHYLVNIGKLCKHIDGYKHKIEIPYKFYHPTLFSRYYTIIYLNKNTGKSISKRFYINNKNQDLSNDKEIFLYLFYNDKSNAEILSTLNWNDYKNLLSELHDEKRSATMKKQSNKPLISKQYYRNGNLWLKTTNDNDTEYQEMYYNSGKLWKTRCYKNGMKEGTFKCFYENGKIESEIIYKNNKKNGISKYYNMQGHLIKEKTYKNNYKNGFKKLYYNNGNVQEIVEYLDSKQIGTHTWYYEDGTIKSEFLISDNEITGINKTYFENGQLSSETSYKNGIKHGIEIKYQENGDIICKNTYDNGKII